MIDAKQLAAPVAPAALTVASGAVLITATLRKKGHPAVQVFVDGRAVSLDTFDLSRARAREKCATEIADAHRADARKALLELADRLVTSSTAIEPIAESAVVAPVELWPDAVEPREVLGLALDRIDRHVHLPLHAAPLVAAWVMLTYLLDVLPVAPILWVHSPTRGCGKSVLLDLVALLGARTLKSENASVAALFRIAEVHRATLILDEIDQWMIRDRYGEISGLLNASFTRGGRFLRTVGDNHQPRAFDVFSFRAVAGIGNTLHDTTRSRSYRITMERAAPGALPEPLQSMYAESWAKPMRQQLARASDQLRDGMAARLADADATPFPPQLDGRARDLWLPVLALGHELGEPWLSRLTDACVAMSRASSEDIVDVGELLMLDCRTFFAERDQQPAQPHELLTWLLAREDSPWPEYQHGRPLTARGLATLLRRFQIKSEPSRIDDVKARWLRPDFFAVAWSRYLPTIEKTIRHGPHNAYQPSPASHPSQSQNEAPGTRRTDGTLGTHLRTDGENSSGEVWPTPVNGTELDLPPDSRVPTGLPNLLARVQPVDDARPTHIGPAFDVLDDQYWASLSLDPAA